MILTGKEVAGFFSEKDRKNMVINPNGVDLQVEDIEILSGSDPNEFNPDVAVLTMGFLYGNVRGMVESSISLDGGKTIEYTVKQLNNGKIAIGHYNPEYFYVLRGVYRMRIKQTINIPNDMMGIVFPRSSLARLGMMASLNLWDSGYSGKGIILCHFLIPLIIGKNERFFQLCLFEAKKSTSYKGYYKNEKI